MSTGLYDPSVDEVRTRTHRQVLRAVAYGGTLAAPLELDLTAARLTYDEATSPRVTADVEAVADTLEALAELAAIDPRTGTRVALEAGYVLEDGTEDVLDLADLGVRFVTVSRPANTVRLGLASDEALVVDASAAVNAPVTGATHVAAISTLIKQAISPAPTITASGPAGGAVTVNPVTDRWATIADLADRLGVRVYDDGTRRWRIVPDPRVASVPDVVLAGGRGGTLTDTVDSTDRESWANYIAHVYQWRDAAEVDRRVQATAVVLSGPYRITGPAGKRIVVDYRNVPTTQDAANAAASAVLARQLTRSTAQTVTAVAAWWLRPGHTARVSTIAGTADRLVSRVTFRWPDRLMDVTSRKADLVDDLGQPVAIGTTTPVPPPETPTAPTPDPAPETATKQTYTSTWTANAFATYRGTGVKRTDSLVDHETAHGNSGTGTNGNQSAVILFTAANSTGDETGKTITQALTGATVQRVRFRAKATHWYSYAGGTGRLGYYAGTSIPASYTGAKPYVSAKDWKRNTFRTVDLTSTAFKAALVAGTSRGVTIGPGASSSTSYYGKLAADGSNAPTLEITYSK